MKHPELIVMLTWHDVTVENAKEIFLAAKDAPAKYWGFKDVGLPVEQMKDLTACMKEAGKVTFMECLGHTEEETMAGMRIAAECGFDILLGAHYFPESEKYAAELGLRHFPFIGQRRDHALFGTIEEITQEAVEVCKSTVAGINMSAFRYRDGAPEALIRSVVEAVEKPVTIAGSVDSFERIDFLKKCGIMAFTIGGAFFEKKFGETFSEQIAAVDAYLKR